MVKSLLPKQLEPLSLLPQPKQEIGGSPFGEGKTGHLGWRTQALPRAGCCNASMEELNILNLGHCSLSFHSAPRTSTAGCLSFRQIRRAFSGESDHPKKINPKILTSGGPQWNCPATEDSCESPPLHTELPTSCSSPTFKYKRQRSITVHLRKGANMKDKWGQVEKRNLQETD